MQIDLGTSKPISGVIISGRANYNSQYVTRVKIQVSDSTTFTTTVGTFDVANAIGNNEVEVPFVSEERGRYVRIVVLTWVSHISMRAGVRGGAFISKCPSNELWTIAENSADMTIQSCRYARDKTGCSVKDPTPPPLGIFEGKYYYLNSATTTMPDVASLQPSAVTQTESIDYPTLVKFQAAVPSIQPNWIAAIWTGPIMITKAGAYTFSTTSDDGSHLWIDGTVVVDNSGLHGAVEKTGVVTLTVGVHQMKADFFENRGGEYMVVKYSGADTGNVKVLLTSGSPAPPSETLVVKDEGWVAVDDGATFDVATSTSSGQMSVVFNKAVTGRFVRISVMAWNEQISLRAAVLTGFGTTASRAAWTGSKLQ